MNIEGLISEIKNDPLARGYSGMSDEELFASLSEKNRSKFIPITSATLLRWSGVNGRYVKIEDAANNSGLPAELRSACKAALAMITREDTTLDFTDSDESAMLTGLVAANILSDEDQASLVALATVAISRAEEINCGELTSDYLAYIRSIN